MKAVFVSSVQRGFGEVRAAAAKGIESLGITPVMAESAGASAASPQRALQDEVRGADLFLLLLGPHYGDLGESGRSPTEDEYDEAVRLGKPVFVLKQNVGLEAAQQEFLARTRGSWEHGRLSGAFNHADDAGYAVVQALRAHAARGQAADPEDADRARERVVQLVFEGQNRNVGSGSKARFIALPVGRPATSGCSRTRR